MAEVAKSASELEIVPRALRTRLGWDHRHDEEARRIMRDMGLKLPRDRELIRQLTVVRVAQGPLPWLPPYKGG